MKGISYITDRKNKRTAVIIDIKTLQNYNEGVEDLLDGIVAESREDEEKVPLSAVIKNLKKAGRLK
ncbi:MAG: hypothetical protein JWO03_3092 [Bacteroidetes bacterium]|nr:hypothetical protein [Bacteroidota bacterium]